MKFLAMVIALSAQQVLKRDNLLQRDQWLYDYAAFVARHVSAPGVRVVLVLAAVPLLAAWLLSLLDHWFFGLAEMLAIAAMFLWSLGREDYHTALERYAARAPDAADAAEAVAVLWAPGLALADSGAGDAAEPAAAPATEQAQATEQAREAEQSQGTEEPLEERHAAALQRISYAGFARWFAPLFYFALGGPLPALVYRSIALLAARAGDTRYERLLAWADWIPARLLVLSFALTGDFLAVTQRGLLQHFADSTPAPQLIADAAESACGSNAARAVGDVLYRSAALWLVILSGALILF